MSPRAGAAIVGEASARPWMPPIMLREVASAGAHLDTDTRALMNAVFATLGKVIAQGCRDGVFVGPIPCSRISRSSRRS